MKNICPISTTLVNPGIRRDKSSEIQHSAYKAAGKGVQFVLNVKQDRNFLIEAI